MKNKFLEMINSLNSLTATDIVFIVAVAVAIVALGIIYARKRKLEGIRADVYQLFLKAEYLMNEKGERFDGLSRMEWVIKKAYPLIPVPLQFFVSEAFLKKLFEKWFREIKDLLDDGKKNKSVEEEKKE